MALPYCLSTVGTTSIEDLAATGHPRLWFQLYVLKDRGHTRSLVERAAAAGYEALEVSVDTAVPGHRARDVRNGLTIPPQLSARTILDIGLHPGYWAEHAAQPDAQLRQPRAPGADGAGRTVADMGARFDPSVDWDDLDRLRGLVARAVVDQGAGQPRRTPSVPWPPA